MKTSFTPTKRGIQIDEQQFALIEDNFETIRLKWPGGIALYEMNACYMSHNDKDAFEACSHCNPPYTGE